VMKLKNVETVKSLGNVALAQKLEGEGNQMIADSAAALSKITGQNYGSDLPQWNAWWEANKQKVGPTPQIIQYTANPPPEKVHFDPRLLQNMPQTPQ